MIRKIKHTLFSFYRQMIFSLAASENPIYTGYYKYFYRPSEETPAWYLDKYSKMNPGLSVVQIGANDGFAHDPLLKFIKRDKWKGVLLEPQKYVLEKYLNSLHRKSNGIKTLNAALDHEDGHRPLYIISFSKARWATGIASFDREALVERVKSGHVKRRAIKTGDQLPEKEEDYISSINVRTICPDTLFKEYDIDKVDLLSIDAEGYDYEILKIFDPGKTRPGLIIFEHSHLEPNTLQECDNFLEGNGYRLKRLAADTIAVHHSANFPELSID